MDRTAIEAISDLATANVSQLAGVLDDKAIVLPDRHKLQSLEHLKSCPDFFRANFKTHVLSEFIKYLRLHGTGSTSVFINTENSTAKAIIDQGSSEDPLWGFHKAEIALKNTPEYAALLGSANRNLSQQDFIDFCEDWKQNIGFYLSEEDDSQLVFDKAIRTLRKLTTSSSSTKEQKISSFAASTSALEQIEIKSGEDPLPGIFVFTAKPHDDFDPISFVCQLRSVASEKNVLLKFRITQIDSIMDDIANIFRHRIVDEAKDLTVFIGACSYQS